MNDHIKMRFLSNIQIDPSTNCWNWTAGLWNGYGSLYFQNKRYKAHRVSFLIANGFEANVCRHKCDNRKCVNPDHLESGTYKDNTTDMMNRGRWRNQHIGKTHCVNGHELVGENISRSGNKRICRICAKERMARFKENKRLLQFKDA